LLARHPLWLRFAPVSGRVEASTKIGKSLSRGRGIAYMVKEDTGRAIADFDRVMMLSH
jgi:hypothetical protein